MLDWPWGRKGRSCLPDVEDNPAAINQGALLVEEEDSLQLQANAMLELLSEDMGNLQAQMCEEFKDRQQYETKRSTQTHNEFSALMSKSDFNKGLNSLTSHIDESFQMMHRQSERLYIALHSDVTKALQLRDKSSRTEVDLDALHDQKFSRQTQNSSSTELNLALEEAVEIDFDAPLEMPIPSFLQFGKSNGKSLPAPPLPPKMVEHSRNVDEMTKSLLAELPPLTDQMPVPMPKIGMWDREDIKAQKFTQSSHDGAPGFTAKCGHEERRGRSHGVAFAETVRLNYTSMPSEESEPKDASYGLKVDLRHPDCSYIADADEDTPRSNGFAQLGNTSSNAKSAGLRFADNATAIRELLREDLCVHKQEVLAAFKSHMLESGNVPAFAGLEIGTAESFDVAGDEEEAEAFKSKTLASEAVKSLVHAVPDEDPEKNGSPRPSLFQKTKEQPKGFLDKLRGNDSDLTSMHYRVEDQYYETGIAQAVAQNDWFVNTCFLVIVLNSIYIGVESDLNHQEALYSSDWFFFLSENFFCLFFASELLVRYCAFRVKLDCLRDQWFKIDLFMLVLMVLETWVLAPAQKLMEGGDVPFPVEPFRLLRLLRLSRLARLMKNVPELVTMTQGLLQGSRACGASVFMIFILVYIWGIALHSIMKDEDDMNAKLKSFSGLHFKRLGDCMWILLIDGTFMLDGTGDILTTLVFSQKLKFWFATSLLLTFVFLSAMVVCNMLIGVLCEVVAQVARRRRDDDAIKLLKDTMLIHLKQFDDGDGMISKEEFDEIMSLPASIELLEDLNVDRVFMLALQKMLYTKSTTEIPIKGIMELMLTCRADTPATVHTIANSLSYLTHRLDQLDKSLTTSVRSSIRTMSPVAMRRDPGRK